MKPILDQYAPKNIYNWDETALFWRPSSGACFVAVHEKIVKGRKKIKARVAILRGVSMAGEKCPLMCIGTTNKPRWPTVCGKIADAPIQYLSASKGWMTFHLFSDLLKAFNRKLKIAGRKALLLDNCSSHRGFDVEYDRQKTNLHVVMLPQNTTAKLPPCDQCVIRSLKAQYRHRLGKRLLHQEAN